MKLAILREADPAETRVAASPDSVKRFIGLGFEVAVETGAGAGSRLPDAEFEAAGARVLPGNAILDDADVVLAVRRPEPARLRGVKSGALVIAIMDPYGAERAIKELAGTGASAFAMELMPRITRAQTMDVLSSQANLAGYRAVVEAAEIYDRAFPMMMTAAGTVPAARVFVMGAGVAGLQAIATARRLGAIVSATDVRPAAKEQVESLGAKFVAVEDEEFRQAETAAGYAKEMSEGYRRKQADLVAAHIAKQDIVITTALIPGRPAPRLVSRAMLESMRSGSVVVDLAVERGGNVELAKSGEVVEHNGVRIAGHLNMPGRLAATASQLYARNLFAFVETFVDKSQKTLKVDWTDELVKATLLTRDGTVVHPGFGGVAPPPAEEKAPEVAPVAPEPEPASPQSKVVEPDVVVTPPPPPVEEEAPEPKSAAPEPEPEPISPQNKAVGPDVAVTPPPPPVEEKVPEPKSAAPEDAPKSSSASKVSENSPLRAEAETAAALDSQPIPAPAPASTDVLGGVAPTVPSEQATEAPASPAPASEAEEVLSGGPDQTEPPTPEDTTPETDEKKKSSPAPEDETRGTS